MLASHALVHGRLAAMWLQTTDFNSAENTHLLMIFIGILAVSIAVIALVVLVAAVVVAKAVKRVMQMLDEVKGKSMPIIASTQGIIGNVQGLVADLTPKIKRVTEDLTPKIKSVTDDLTPKIKTISANVDEMAAIAKKNMQRFDGTLEAANETARDANQKARAQVDRVDGMVSSALNATSHVAQTIHHSIRVPVNQVAGVVSGFKAGLDSLLGSGRASSSKDGGTSPEARRESEMERITSRYAGSHQPTSAVTTAVGDDMLPGTSVKPGAGSLLDADVIAGQRRAADLRSAPDASDLAEPGVKPILPNSPGASERPGQGVRPVLPKRFQ